jgi:hypothetical protein
MSDANLLKTRTSRCWRRMRGGLGIQAEAAVGAMDPQNAVELSPEFLDVDPALDHPAPYHSPLTVQLARDLGNVPLVTAEQGLDLGLFRPGTPWSSTDGLIAPSPLIEIDPPALIEIDPGQDQRS